MKKTSAHAVLVVIGALVLVALGVAIWMSRDELDTLPQDVDDIDWLAEFKRWDRWE